jgi:hypothetical protein
MVGLAVQGRQLFKAVSCQQTVLSRALFHESLQAERLHQTRADGRIRLIAACAAGSWRVEFEQTPFRFAKVAPRTLGPHLDTRAERIGILGSDLPTG